MSAAWEGEMSAACGNNSPKPRDRSSDEPTPAISNQQTYPMRTCLLSARPNQRHNSQILTFEKVDSSLLALYAH